MRWALTPPQAHVDFHGTLSVDGEALVRIDGNTEETRVGVDELILVPDNRVPQYTSITQIGQARHVVSAVEFGWINLSDLILLENFGLLYEKIQ